MQKLLGTPNRAGNSAAPRPHRLNIPLACFILQPTGTPRPHINGFLLARTLTTVQNLGRGWVRYRPTTFSPTPQKGGRRHPGASPFYKNEVKENTELECHLWAKNIGGPSKRDEITALPTLVKGPRKWNQKKWLATIVGQFFWNQSKRDEKNFTPDFGPEKLGGLSKWNPKNWLATMGQIFLGPK